MSGRRPPQVRLETPSLAHEAEFLAAVRRSRGLHHPWVTAPGTSARFRRYIAHHTGERHLSHLVFSPEHALVGVINVSEIVRGVFHSAFLGYCAFVPYHQHGYMEAALRRVVTACFGRHRLHRLEANIQPDNARSKRLVKRLGFVREGYSERYLKVGGRWRDHERWAITRERWQALRKQRGQDSR